MLPALNFARRTHPGLVRAINEDAAIAETPMFLVADGMGGHDAGDLASWIAIDAFSNAVPRDEYATMDHIAAGYANARTRIQQLSQQSEHGAGCTLSGVFLTQRNGVPHWLVANIGDSRVYEIAKGRVRQLTIDHTLRDEMIREGANPDDPELPSRSVITRALGSPADDIDTWILPVRAHSRVLVCTDGVHGEIDEMTLNSILTGGGDVNFVAESLVHAVIRAGARDNLSFVLVDVGELPEPPADPVFDGDASEDAPEFDVDTLDVTAPVDRVNERADD